MTGDGANENNNTNNLVARLQQQQQHVRIQTTYIVTVGNATARHSAADVHLARSIDRAYESPPHRGRQLNRPDVRRSDES
jgi:hypothetical protein